MDILQWLEKWYLDNCDGDWEHCYGIHICTLDNPGWSIEIDLIDTYLEYEYFDTIQKYNNEADWVHCSVVDGVFRGGGSAGKFEEILNIFYEWATKVNEESAIKR